MVGGVLVFHIRLWRSLGARSESVVETGGGEQVRNAGRREPPDSGGQGFEERKTETRPGRRETEAQASDLAETGRSRNNPDELPGSPTNQISEGTTQGF